MAPILGGSALAQSDPGRSATGLWYAPQGRGPALVPIHGSNLDSRWFNWIAVDFALAHPERVDRLVLVGPTVSGYRSTTMPVGFRAADAFLHRN